MEGMTWLVEFAPSKNRLGFGVLNSNYHACTLRDSAASMCSIDTEPDVVIVGGGPCGLALAIGMRQLGYRRVVVVERCAEAVDA